MFFIVKEIFIGIIFPAFISMQAEMIWNGILSTLHKWITP